MHIYQTRVIFQFALLAFLYSIFTDFFCIQQIISHGFAKKNHFSRYPAAAYVRMGLLHHSTYHVPTYVVEEGLVRNVPGPAAVATTAAPSSCPSNPAPRSPPSPVLLPYRTMASPVTCHGPQRVKCRCRASGEGAS